MDEEKILTTEPGQSPPPAWMRAMDLTREEYARFQLMLSRMGGSLRFQKPAAIMFLIMAVMCISAIVYVSVSLGAVDWVTVLMMGVMIALGALILAGVPAYLKKGARQTYDQTQLGGGDFYGYVRITPTYIEKETASGSFRVPFNSTAVYLEDADMMVFMAQGTPKGIVLPARCLTAEDAAFVRSCVFAPGVSMRRQVAKPLLPQATQPLPVRPLSDGGEQELLQLDVQYTTEQFLQLTTDTSWHRFYKILPLYGVSSLLCGALIGWLEENIGMGLIVFAVMLVVLILLGVFMPRSRVKRALAFAPPEKLRMGIRFTDRGVITLSPTGDEQGRFGWAAVKRAVERPDSVEFFLRGGFLRIPKTSIPDMELLRQIVDSHKG